MKIYLAKSAGFCEGVQKAINRTFERAAHKSPNTKLYTFGPLIHNPQTLCMLEEKGIGVINNPYQTPADGEIIIRTHGVTPEVYRRIKARSGKIHNATCGKVAKVQSIIKKFVTEGDRVIIIGDTDHAEVAGLLGYAAGKGQVIASVEEANNVQDLGKTLVVSQTTFDLNKYKAIIHRLNSRLTGLKIVNTICDSTHDRQTEVKKLCRFVDAMMVVGGKGSANTGRLVSICREQGVQTFHIEYLEEISRLNFSGIKRLGITAGASTPRWLINQALEKVEEKDSLSILGILRKISKFLVYSYSALSVAAAALSYVFTTYMQIPTDFQFAAIAFLYVYALYNMNTYFLKKQEMTREKESLRFLRSHKTWLGTSTFLAIVGTLFLAARAGTVGLAVVTASIVAGALFYVRLFSGPVLKKIRFKSLQEIPGSKDIFTPLAWSTVIVLVPAFSGVPADRAFQVIISFLITALLIFLRSTLLHLVDIEEDRIVGRDTIPTVLGEKKTVTIVCYTVSIFIMALFIFSLAGIGWRGVWLFSINAAMVLVLIRLYRRHIIMRYYNFSLALDFNLILSGAVAFMGKIFIN